jgi:hypothetical protein
VPFSLGYKQRNIGNITKYYKTSIPKEIIYMAQLGSPGVQVNVIDESFYNPATPGTIPLILVASAQNKSNASGTGIAAGTLAENANQLYLATSQKDLTDRFGTPVFQKDAGGNAIQGSELNEYGLFAAYSFLGASSSAYVLRANVDLGALVGRAIAPVGRPVPNTYWVDTSRSRFGIFEWDGSSLQQFKNKDALILNSKNDVVAVDGSFAYKPKPSVGSINDYAVVVFSDSEFPQDSNKIWFKNATGNWVVVGSSEWINSWPIASSKALTNSISVSSGSTVGVKITVGNLPPVEVLFDGAAPSGTTYTAANIASEINSQLPSGSTLTAVVNNNKVELFVDSNVAVTLSNPEAEGATSMLPLLELASKTYYSPNVQFSAHNSIPEWTSLDDEPRPTGSVWFKTTEFNLGAKWIVKKYNDETRLFETKDAPIYVGGEAALAGLDPLGGGVNIPVDTLFVDANFDRNGEAKFKLMFRSKTDSSEASVIAPSSVNFSNQTVTIAESVRGSAEMNSITFTITTTDVEEFVEEIQKSGLINVVASYNSSTRRLTLEHRLGGEIHLTGSVWSALGFNTSVSGVYTAPTGVAAQLRISNWRPLSSSVNGYVVDDREPTDTPEDDTLWYASYQNQVDIMVHDGRKWVGYRNYTPFANTNPTGPFVQATRPTKQSDGSDLVNNDLWIDTSDQDQYGKNIKRWNNQSKTWDPIDVTDKTSQFGIIFADARWGSSGATGNTAASIVELLESDYLDPDAPDPAAYPRGMLLWNTRRSGFNIKQYKKNYINTAQSNIRFNGESMAGYGGNDGNQVDRWVSVSGQDLNQVAFFGRRAQRAFVVGQLKVAINTNQRILDEDNIFFNLIACPGYPELISDMVNLNNARNGTALVVGDTPLRLEPNAQSLINYGTDFANTGIDGELGLHTNSDHLAVYYPSGLTTDLTGSNVVVPASHMMLRTIAISDQRSFQWFAPAGTRRGGITNASSVGYIRNGSFVPVSINQGTRDQMAQIKINPITNIPGAGLVAFGQQTRTGVNSSLDRINVARLVSYLRRQLGIITRPFIFEPNDKQTRSEIKNVCESLLLDLVSLRGVYDFIVICDETNNTPSIIANNQLYVDIAVEPVKAVEFIYIPLRLKNVGDIKSRQ